jgi:hypothetical protein
MNLSQLRERGAMVSPELVPREITWARPTEDGVEDSVVFTVCVVKHSFGAARRMFESFGKLPDHQQPAAFIAETIRFGDDGAEQISTEEALQLEPGLAHALLAAANEVNATGPTAKN